jgi:folylpolyglutamate synthase/dihydropteroate synthase
MPAGDLAQKLVDVRLPVLPAGSIEDALTMALSEGAGPDELVVVAGSVFLAGAVRDLVGLR